jgi:hypothetical protein
MDEPVIACTLSPAAFADRADAWRALIDGWLVGRDRIPGGLRLDFRDAPGVAQAAAELLRLESECCPWMQARVAARGSVLSMELTAAGMDAANGLRAAFGA